MGNQPFSEKDVRRVLGSAEGQRLLALLNQDGGQALRQAADALRNGNTDEAQKAVAPLLQSEEAAALLQKLGRR